MILTDINIAYLIGGVIIGGIIFWKKKKTTKEYVYVDTTGIDINPPQNYIDVEQNKTINFKLGRESISICHLPIKLNVKYLEKIAYLYKLIIQESEYVTKGKIDEVAHQFRYRALYNQTTQLVYGLSKSFVNSKRKFKRDLFRRAKDDTDFIMDIIEQIINFWLYRKKKAQMLAQNQTLLSTVGSAYTWSSLTLDSHGRRLIKPRYASASTMDGITMTKSQEKIKTGDN